MNVSEQIADIRERLMRVETMLDHMQKNGAPQKVGIVIPVSVATVLVNGLIEVAKHFV